jgi:N-acetylmuramoyl-L-alanine amidase
MRWRAREDREYWDEKSRRMPHSACKTSRNCDRVAFARRAGIVAFATLSLLVCAPFESSLGASPASNSTAAPANPPVAVDVRLVDDGGAAKLTFDLSAPVEARAFSMTDPDRIIIDVPEVNFQVDPALGRAPQGRPLGQVVKSFRFGLLGPGKSRIVIDLASPARVTRVATQAIAEGARPARLQIELSRCEPAVFQQAAKEAEPDAASKADAQAQPEPLADAQGPMTIVLDPGHGGVDSGAIGPGGAVEKTIVYQFSSELAKKLTASGRYRVMMTRDGDEFVSLGDRVKMARDANAALLISIHADTLQAAADVSGATVYTVADRASDAEAARIAERENASDKAAGVEQKEEAAGVADILFDLKRRETRAYAHIFSRGVVEEWRGAGRLNRNPERSAGFMVLKAPDFPSILLELGYLSSPQDVKSMTSAEWRDKTTSSLAAAVDHFFVPRTDAERPGAKAQANANSLRP